MTPDQINHALAPYGAGLTENGFIQKGGTTTSVRIVSTKGRLRFESATGQLLGSGPNSAGAIEHFVERFWFWTKAK